MIYFTLDASIFDVKKRERMLYQNLVPTINCSEFCFENSQIPHWVCNFRRENSNWSPSAQYEQFSFCLIVLQFFITKLLISCLSPLSQKFFRLRSYICWKIFQVNLWLYLECDVTTLFDFLKAILLCLLQSFARRWENSCESLLNQCFVYFCTKPTNFFLPIFINRYLIFVRLKCIK